MTIRAFLLLVRNEARLKMPALFAGVAVVLLLNAFVTWRVHSPPLRMIAAGLVAAVPVVYLTLGGLSAFSTEYRSGALTRLRAMPVSGHVVVAAKYTWLLLEFLLLGSLLVASGVYFLNGTVPLGELVLRRDGAWLLPALLAVLLVPPAVALASGVLARAARWRYPAGAAAFALLWLAYVLLADAAADVRALGEVVMRFTSLPRELCRDVSACFVRANVAFLVLQPVFAVFALWVAGRAFDTIDA